ncbi:MAG TPA: carboxymuconolactone decarboxylase family protein, partial [Gemmatimonadaceae bacterium]|nr:carboxymuconolactone decarboxylase family protein [Gemmatimonadaceae bacterium]
PPGVSMTLAARHPVKLSAFDDATRELVRLAALVAAADEGTVRDALATAAVAASPVWIEEVLLQSYLFAGFPRALNAMREWRRLPAGSVRGEARRGASDPDAGDLERLRARGEATCRLVYGRMYERLRANIDVLHPALDEWMIVEGYGKVLSRPALDLPRRELCIVAACAASGQDRQLHSHLHGALNVGVAPEVMTSAIEALGSVVGEQRARAVRMLWARVLGK